MKKKTFQYKGQMINYYNKVKENSKITRIWFGYNAITGTYELTYSFN